MFIAGLTLGKLKLKSVITYKIKIKAIIHVIQKNADKRLILILLSGNKQQCTGLYSYNQNSFSSGLSTEKY